MNFIALQGASYLQRPVDKLWVMKKL